MKARTLSLGIVGVLIFATAGVSCRVVEVSTAVAPAATVGMKKKSPKTPPRVAHHEAENRESIWLRQRLNPLWWVQNIDDPEPPEWYKPGARLRTAQWRLRNPFHNFTFYVVGVADRDFRRVGRAGGENFHPDGGFNWAVLRVGPVILPFVSYHGPHVRFYALWRERGNLGAKLNFSLKAKPTPNEERELKRRAKELAAEK